MAFNDEDSDILCEFGETYDIAFWARTENGSDGTIDFKQEWYPAPGQPGPPSEFLETPVPLNAGDWQRYTLQTTPPVATKLYFRYVFSNYFGIETIYMDNGFFGKAVTTVICCPDPEDDEQGVAPSATALSWKREWHGKYPQVELYWGSVDDPNFWIQSPDKIMDLADVNSFDLGDAIGGAISLEPGEYYYWALKYEDPNDGNWGAPLAEGPAWSFDTLNSPPIADAGLHYDKWMDAVSSPITIGLDASYTDDGLPVGGNVTHSWNTVAGVTYIPHQFCQDPNVTISAAGDYTLELTVNDGEVGSDSSDTTLIRIFANSDDRLRVHYPLDTNALDSDNTDPCDIHNGTLVDNASFNPSGQVAGAIELDGTDDDADELGDHISIDDTGSDPNDAPWDPGYVETWENSDLIDGMTISAWMKLDEDGWSKDNEGIVAKHTAGWELMRNGSSQNVGFSINQVGSASSGANLPVNDSQWHQVVGVFDRNTVKLYVDGLEAGSATAGASQAPKSPGKILIGNTNNVGDYSFGGLIDQVRIFDAAVPWWAEHTGTPGIVEMYRADGGHINCGGVYLAGDTNEDCLITLADFALVCSDWLDCNDVADENCPLSHHLE
jgi:hypothetical protein